MKFLFIQLGRIGDMILFTPVIRKLKEKYPDSEIHVICGRKNNVILKENPFINKLYIFNKTPLGLVKFISGLRNNYYDYYIDPKDHYSSEGFLISKFVKARTKIGFNKPGRKNFDIGLVVDEKRNNLHRTEANMLCLEHIGIGFNKNDMKPDLYVGKDANERCKQFSDSLDNDFITINISTGSPTRKWETEKYIEFIKAVKSDTFDIILSGVPADEKELELIMNSCPYVKRHNTSGYEDVTALVRKSKILVTPDTSLVHVASAFSVPLVSLYVADNREFNKYYPFSPNQRILFAPEGTKLNKDIPVRDVVNAFNDLLAEINSDQQE